MLRDSGCDEVVVSHKRYPVNLEDPLTLKTRVLMSVDRSLTEIPTTLVFVKTPIFTGEVEALCFSIPIYDLVIGNIHALCSIKCKKQFSSNWRFAKASEVREMDGDTVQGDTVRTRAQQTRKNPSKWLVVPAGPGRNAREHLTDARWMHNICTALHHRRARNAQA